MSESNQEILAVMKALGSGNNTGQKLKFDPRTKKLKKFQPGQNDPDNIAEIDASDAVVF
jgi:hypothetical protein